jgi:hypothetical protein
MEAHTCNSPKQWISKAYHSQPEEETDYQKTKTKTPNNTTNQKVGNILISQSTNTKNN